MSIAISTIPTQESSLSIFFKKILARLEWFRVKNHLQIVEKELLRKNVEHLSGTLRKERVKNIRRLHNYWKNGSYPKNTAFFDKRVPYFKDIFGTPCAMAYLIEQSGRQDLVDSVVRSNNNVYINDIDRGPVIDWIGKSGLTKSEAARIQPTYGECAFGGCHSSLFYIVPWIVGSVGFIIAETISYKVSSWVTFGNRNRRIVVWVYFTLYNLLGALALGILTVELIRFLELNPF